MNNNITITNTTTTTITTTTNDHEVLNRQSVTITAIFFLLVMFSIVGMKFHGHTMLLRDVPIDLPELDASRDENDNDDDLENRNRRRQQYNEKVQEQRYLDIESLLINMYVMEHDDRICPNHSHHSYDDNDGEKCRSEGYSMRILTEEESRLGQHNATAENKIHHQQQLEKSDAIREGDEETNNNDPIVCSICLDPFCIRDIVSISPSSQHDRSSSSSSSCCHHVFHHGCIKEWLLRHTTCPSCRQEFVIDVGGDGDEPSYDAPIITTISELRKYASQDQYPPNPNPDHRHYRSTTCYCLQHGIVTLEQDVRATDHHITFLSPPPEELMLLRLHPTKRSEQQHNKQQYPDDGAATVTTTTNSVVGEIESVSTSSFSDAV